MLVRKYLNNETKREINRFVIKNTFIYVLFMSLLVSFLLFISMNFEKKFFIFLFFYFSIFFSLIVWGYIRWYTCFIKKKSKSLLTSSWEELSPHEKKYYITQEKLMSLIFISGIGGLIFLLIFISTSQ